MNNSNTNKTTSLTNKKFYPYPARKPKFSKSDFKPNQAQIAKGEYNQPMNRDARISASTSSHSVQTPGKDSRFLGSGPLDLHTEQLFLYLLEMKYLTLEQIIRKFPEIANLHGGKHDEQNLKTLSEKDRQFTLVARAIKELCVQGFLKTKDPILNDQSLILATEKSYETLKKENPNKDIPQPTVKYFPWSVNHDLLLNTLRIRFEEFKFLSRWVSEKTLDEIPFIKQTFQKLPDAVCRKKDEKGYFLELEISKKSSKEYEARIAEYKKILEKDEIKNSGIEGVVFVCTDPKVQELIRSLLPQSKKFSSLPIQRYLKDF